MLRQTSLLGDALWQAERRHRGAQLLGEVSQIAHALGGVLRRGVGLARDLGDLAHRVGDLLGGALALARGGADVFDDARLALDRAIDALQCLSGLVGQV